MHLAYQFVLPAYILCAPTHGLQSACGVRCDMTLPATALRRATRVGIDASGPHALDTNSEVAATVHLSRPAGRIAYSLLNQGPLVICIPRMGDVRSVYASLASALDEAGLRVATMDLCGHGDSDVTFKAYDDAAAGSDIVALAELLGGPAILVSNSMCAGAACWAAAEAPAMTAGLVCSGRSCAAAGPAPFQTALSRLVASRQSLGCGC